MGEKKEGGKQLGGRQLEERTGKHADAKTVTRGSRSARRGEVWGKKEGNQKEHRVGVQKAKKKKRQRPNEKRRC